MRKLALLALNILASTQVFALSDCDLDSSEKARISVDLVSEHSEKVYVSVCKTDRASSIGEVVENHANRVCSSGYYLEFTEKHNCGDKKGFCEPGVDSVSEYFLECPP
ncbi:hypothetical protein HXX02_00230 [Microbulbifer elongatus]|uniref:Integron gene cassette protein n=1 Tax=Microbulbifer elongatus TaxID=86173 RepID=A0ABT1NVD2_9GAMM|nr:hypothetical protein [Microbulbifer elongatus]MCQ3827862.1 hypothetical protein [Microbulbifer elongatus]